MHSTHTTWHFSLCYDAVERWCGWTVRSTPMHTSLGPGIKTRGHFQDVQKMGSIWRGLLFFFFFNSLFWIHSSCNMISTGFPIRPAGILGQKLRLIGQKPYPWSLRHKVLYFNCCLTGVILRYIWTQFGIWTQSFPRPWNCSQTTCR